ncbi:MAG: biotin--protein ligase [Luteimonas sp.]
MHGEYKVPGGKLVVVDLAVVDDRLSAVQVSGDFFLEPDSALDTINGSLLGLPVDSEEMLLAGAVRVSLGGDAILFGVTPEAIAIAVRRAIDAGIDGART